MLRFIAIFLLLAFSVANSAPVDLSPPKNAIGVADVNGHLQYVHRFGDIQFSDNFSIPLRFDFSSRRIVEQELSDFGWHGWACGAIESRAVLLRNREILKIELLCAKTMLLERSEQDENLYYTSDKSWKGRVEGGQISVSREDGWDLVFENGRVHQFTTEKGKLITWKRDEQGRVIAVQEEGSAEPQLTLLWGADGNPAQIDIRSEKFRFEFSGETLSAIGWEGIDGGERRFVCEQRNTSIQIETPRLQQFYFSWEKKSGILLSDGVNRYRLKEVSSDTGEPSKILEMTEPTGAQMELVLGESGGKTKLVTPSGREIVTVKITEPGANYGAISEVFLVGDANTKTLLMKNVFDEDGKIVQRLWHGNPAVHMGYHGGEIEGALLPRGNQTFLIENFNVEAQKHIIDFTYRSDGQLENVKVNRQDILSFSFDEENRVTEMSFENRFSKHFSYLEGGNQVEELVLTESEGNPFWYLESSSKGVDKDLVISRTKDDVGRLLSETYADGRILTVTYDKRMRRVSDLTLAPDGKKEISSVSYVYDPQEQKVLRIREDLIRKSIDYSQITPAGVGTAVRGKHIPVEVASNKSGVN